MVLTLILSLKLKVKLLEKTDLFNETQISTQFPHMNYCQSLRLQSGRQDSNLRPSAPKAPHTPLASLGFKAISVFLLSYAWFVSSNKAIFDGNLTAICSYIIY